MKLTFAFILYPTKAKKQGQTNRASFLRTVFQKTAYLERGMPFFAFVSTKAVLVRKIDRSVNEQRDYHIKKVFLFLICPIILQTPRKSELNICRYRRKSLRFRSHPRNQR